MNKIKHPLLMIQKMLSDKCNSNDALKNKNFKIKADNQFNLSFTQRLKFIPVIANELYFIQKTSMPPQHKALNTYKVKSHPNGPKR